jgi:sulfur carrier protein
MVNGQPQETGARNLAELCVTLGYADAKIATAVNGEFVPAASRADTTLTGEDRVEIVAPRQGG